MQLITELQPIVDSLAIINNNLITSTSHNNLTKKAGESVKMELQDIFATTPLAQDMFDELYAKELQILFNDDKVCSESAIESALVKAYDKLILWLSEQQFIYQETTKFVMK